MHRDSFYLRKEKSRSQERLNLDFDRFAQDFLARHTDAVVVHIPLYLAGRKQKTVSLNSKYVSLQHPYI